MLAKQAEQLSWTEGRQQISREVMILSPGPQPREVGKMPQSSHSNIWVLINWFFK